MLKIDAAGTTAELNFRVNGQDVTVQVEPRETLARVLRHRLGLTGTKIGCDAQVCGACTVLVDRKPVSACTIFAFDVAGRDVQTIEGVAKGDSLHPLQIAFINNGGFQCGYCTPGMIMSSVGLLNQNSDPTRQEVADWLEGNICRCTGYEGIVTSVLEVAETLRNGRSGREPRIHGEGAAPDPGEEAAEVADTIADAYWDS
jgi:aerobic-type carbon monoxide dehydrogenase small subunit (CoxS/CutS family)